MYVGETAQLARYAALPLTASPSGGGLRITLVIGGLGMGGAERTVARLANDLSERGHAVTVITVADRGPDFFPLTAGVRRISLDLARNSRSVVDGAFRSARRVRVLRRAIRATRADVCVGFISATNVLMLFALAGLSVPAVVCERSDPRDTPIGFAWRALRRLSYRRADLLVAQTADVAAWMHDHWMPRRTIVIPNGIEPRRLAGSIAQPGQSPYIALVGRLTHQKGVDLFLRAFARCAARHSGWEVMIAGDGPERRRLESLARTLGLERRVHFLGVVAEPANVFPRASLFVLPSRYEGFPNALLEAMAYGLPVVATDCRSGPRCIVRDGIDGVLVPAGDVGALADALDAMLDDPERRVAMGRRAAEVSARFNWEDVMSEWEATLQQVARPSTQAEEVRTGRRFAFGRNWQNFLRGLTEARIEAAEASLRDYLEVDALQGITFLDVGSGSGLLSLAARRLGARVHSFDYDPDSVACTRELRGRYYPDDPDWRVEQGSVLDEAYVSSLGTADIVYSWGVLHHTGAMWRALDHACSLVAPGGKLFIAIYNDQGGASRRWGTIKRLYNRSPAPGRMLMLVGVKAYFLARGFGAWLLGRRGSARTRTAARERRGMDRWHDLVDWVGGYPFEVARPEEVFDFCRARGFTLLRLRTCAGGLGCNQFVFRRSAVEVPVGRA